MTAGAAAMRATTSHPVLFPLWYPVMDGLPPRLWVQLPSPHLMRRAGGTAAKAIADIRRSFAVCSEAFAAALIWVGVSRIFLHIRWRTVPGSPYPFTQYKAPARCAT